jgi:hypothetical protein
LGTQAKPEYRLDTPDLELKLLRKQAEPLDYRFAKPEGQNYYVLKRSDLNYYFKIPEFSVKPILETNRQKLVQSETQAPEAQDNVPPGAETSKLPQRTD